MNCLMRSLLIAGATLALLSGCVSQAALPDTPAPTAAPVLPTALSTATATTIAPTAPPTADNLPLERLIFAEVTFYNTEEERPSSSVLSIIQSDGSGYARVLENNDLDGLHQFIIISPDGSAALTHDYYPGGPNSPAGLAVVDLQGRSFSPVTPMGIDGTFYRIWGFGPPAWLTDSLHIIASRAAFGGTEYPGFGLISLSLEDGSLESITVVEDTHWGDRWVTVSPDGEHIAFLRYLYDPASGADVYPGQVMIAGARGEAFQEIAAAIPYDYYAPGHGLFQFTGPVWSPDGTRLAFFLFDEASQTPGLGIYDITANALAVTPLQPGHYADLSWSPDGVQLVFGGDFEGRDQLYLLSPGDSAPSNISSSPASDINPTWSPGGNYIAFLSDREEAGFYKLYLLVVETMQARKLLDARVMWRPAWLPPAP